MNVFLGEIIFHLKKLRYRLYRIGQKTNTPKRMKFGAVNPMKAIASLLVRGDIFRLLLPVPAISTGERRLENMDPPDILKEPLVSIQDNSRKTKQKACHCVLCLDCVQIV